LGRKVLLVDDDDLQRKLVGAQLGAAGFVVEPVADAVQALQSLRFRAPDAIVSDVLMDDVDGFALCRRIRQELPLADVPVVLVSAYFDEDGDRALADEVGANALVERSPSMQPVIEALVGCLARGGLAAPVPPASGLHVRRVAHRLAQFCRETEAAESRYRTLFEKADDAISVMTPDGYVLDVNPRWEKLRGTPRDELLGLHLSAFSAPGHGESNAAGFQSALLTSAPRSGPVPIAAADGSTVYLEFSHSVVETEGGPNVLAIGRDVTALVEAQQKLEASERRYRSLVENGPEVVWSARPDGSLAFVSPNVVHVLGFTADEMMDGVHGSIRACVHPEDAVRARRAVESLRTSGARFDIELRCKHRHGQWVWLHCRGMAGEDATGAPCINGVVADVTERRLLEEQVREAQKLEAVGQLTAGIAHDFNNALAVIRLNGELLLTALPEDHPARCDAEDIMAASDRAFALTKQLLAFSRRDRDDLAEVDLNQVVESVGRMVSCLIGKSITLTVSCDLALGRVMAVAGQLEQVIANLAVNARDAMPDGGVLTIRTRNVTLAEEPGQWSAGEYVMLAVEDTGCGMDKATQTRIFEPFFTTKDKDRGTGLGLSTSYGIVRRFGGHIGVASEPGRGTAFRVYLPRSSSVL